MKASGWMRIQIGAKDMVRLSTSFSLLMFILLTGGFAFCKTPVCTAQALRLVKALPKLEVSECTKDISNNGKPRTSELWKRTIRAYEKKLALWGQRAWSVPVSSLAACGLDPLSEEESGEVQYTSTISGNGSLRLLITGDPCLPIGAHDDPYNAFLLVKNSDQKIVVTEIKDGGYGGDASLQLDQLTDPNNQPLILLSIVREDAYRPYEVFEVFRVNPKTSRPEPAEIFPVREAAPVTSSKNVVVSWGDGPDPKWLQKDKLADQFENLEENPHGEGNIRVTYRWDGKTYVVVGIKHEASPEAKAIGAYRACLKANFGTTKVCDEPPDADVTCEKQNDLAWLNCKANKLQDALKYAQLALESCKEKSLELKHADYNHKQIQRALQAEKH